MSFCFKHWFSDFHLQLSTLKHVPLLLTDPVGSSALAVQPTNSRVARGSSQHHPTTPSNWYLRHFVYLELPGFDPRSKSMTEKGKMIPYWEFLMEQDSPSSYKQVVDSWCWLYEGRIVGLPLVSLKEHITREKVSDSKLSKRQNKNSIRMLISSSLKWVWLMARLAGRGLYVANASLMSRMRVESRGWKIILREIQVRVRGKWLKMTDNM